MGEEGRTWAAQPVRLLEAALERPRFTRFCVANLPDESITPMSSVTEPGVYYGYAQVSREKEGQVVLSEEESKVFPMVMSLGWNPFYKNKKLSAVCPLDCVLLPSILIP